MKVGARPDHARIDVEPNGNADVETALEASVGAHLLSRLGLGRLEFVMQELGIDPGENTSGPQVMVARFGDAPGELVKLATELRSAVMRSSRMKMMPATHHGQWPMPTMGMMKAATKTLSATGSRSPPRTVGPSRRAI